MAAAISALVLPKLVFGACSHITKIHNEAGYTIEVVELKSASSPPFFKSQWKGSRVIARGGTGTINWTSDFSCTYEGEPRVFDIKLIRKIGTTHYCGGLVQNQSVTVNAPDLCFPN